MLKRPAIDREAQDDLPALHVVSPFAPEQWYVFQNKEI